MAWPADRDIELANCRDWFAAALDGEEGIDWLNGESKKYGGDGWKEAERILRRLKKIATHPSPER